jgi:putative DNA primase/helicase
MPEVVEESVKEYRNEMDVISNFLSECTLTGGNEKAGDLYQGYKTWATENSEYLMSSTKFGIEISKRFEKVKCNNATFYRDIMLSKNYKKYSIAIG